MTHKIILASGSKIRREMLAHAGVRFDVVVSKIDEGEIKQRLCHQGKQVETVVQVLATEKAKDVSRTQLDAIVIGCDQILSFKGDIFDKPKTKENAREQLIHLRGETHNLLSAATICQNGKILWHHTGKASLEMRMFSDKYLDAYLDRNWHSIKHSVGGYKLEEEGVRLFSLINGDYFTVLGMPLLAVLSFLTDIGEIEK